MSTAARRREAFCARDRFGQKPFHYHWDGRTLAFASDVNAVLALIVGVSIIELLSNSLTIGT